jgi:hypothetical protein
MTIGLKVKDGRFRFTAVCDVCGKPIENTAEALVLWKGTNDNNVRIVHLLCYDLQSDKRDLPLSLFLYFASKEAVKNTPRNERAHDNRITELK